jgi:hypothetical protein
MAGQTGSGQDRMKSIKLNNALFLSWMTGFQPTVFMDWFILQQYPEQTQIYFVFG